MVYSIGDGHLARGPAGKLFRALLRFLPKLGGTFASDAHKVVMREEGTIAKGIAA
jgi:hypothetical protein